MGSFESMLSGGHPNSLGRTVEVVDLVLADRERLGELFACYGSADPVVRLRVSNAMKRIEAERHDWLVPLIDPLIDDVGRLDQDSARWTLAQLFQRLADDMSEDQKTRARRLLRSNLASATDWIVLICTLETLAEWARTDPELDRWLVPHIARLMADPRKSVARRAAKVQARRG